MGLAILNEVVQLHLCPCCHVRLSVTVKPNVTREQSPLVVLNRVNPKLEKLFSNIVYPLWQNLITERTSQSVVY